MKFNFQIFGYIVIILFVLDGIFRYRAYRASGSASAAGTSGDNFINVFRAAFKTKKWAKIRSFYPWFCHICDRYNIGWQYNNVMETKICKNVLFLQVWRTRVTLLKRALQNTNSRSWCHFHLFVTNTRVTSLTYTWRLKYSRDVTNILVTILTFLWFCAFFCFVCLKTVPSKFVRNWEELESSTAVTSNRTSIFVIIKYVLGFLLLL